MKLFNFSSADTVAWFSGVDMNIRAAPMDPESRITRNTQSPGQYHVSKFGKATDIVVCLIFSFQPLVCPNEQKL